MALVQSLPFLSVDETVQRLAAYRKRYLGAFSLVARKF